MATRKIALSDGFDAAIAVTADILAGGGVAVFPTETVYGIGVAARDDSALARLVRLKGRDGAKPFQRLAPDPAAAVAMGATFPPGALRLAKRFWPGALTLVLPAGDGTLGVRVPDSAFVLAVMRRLGLGIVSSSANPAGLPPPLDAAAAGALFPEGIDLLVDGGPSRVGTASTVVRCRDDGYEILRAGAIAEADIAAAWQGKGGAA